MKTLPKLGATFAASSVAVAVLTMGCGPDVVVKPPNAIKAFNPDSGTQFTTPNSAYVTLTALSGPEVVGDLVCYRVDETGSEEPAAIFEGACDTGSTEYTGPVQLTCDAIEPYPGPIDERTVSIVFGWDNGEDPASVENRFANYTIDCSELLEFGVVIYSEISGLASGTGDGTGTASLNGGTGELIVTFELTSITNLTNATTGAIATYTGVYDGDINGGNFTDATGISVVTSCENNWQAIPTPVINACNSVNFSPEVIDITDGIPAVIPAVSGEFLLETFTETAVDVVSYYTFTRTN